MGHEDESSSSDLLESYDNKDEDDNGTGAEGNNYDGDGNGRGDINTGAGGGSVEWIRFLSPSARMEALGAMEKSKASSSTASRKNLKLGKSKSKIAQKGKAPQKLMKNLLKTAGR